jgi:formiminotetrahydrofolate cyclodeaminase
MQSVWKCTLASLRDSTGSDKPIATSGAISIIVAVYGCSLALMALKLSAKKKADRKTSLKRAQLTGLIKHQSQLLCELADRDISAFRTFLASSVARRPSPANEQPLSEQPSKTMRNASVLEVTRIPLIAAEEIEKVLPLLEMAVPLCKDNLRCDLAVAANNCFCAITNLVLSISQNATELEPSIEAKLERKVKKMRAAAGKSARNITRMVSRSA